MTASVLSAAATSQCVQPSQLQSTPGLQFGAIMGTPSLDPGPADYFDVAVDAGIVLTQLGIVYVLPPVGTSATVEVWIVDTTGGLNGGSLLANLPQTYRRNPPTTPPAPWVLAATAPITYASSGLPTFTAPLNVHLNAGSYGMCIVTAPNGTAPALTGLPATVGAQATDQVLRLTSRGFAAAAFANPLPSSSAIMPVVQFNYALDPATAYSTAYGSGCSNRTKTFYQAFDGPANPAGAAPNVTTAFPHLQLQPVGAPLQYSVSSAAGTYPLMGTPGATNYFTATSAGATPTHVNNGNPAISLFGGWDDSVSVLYTLPFTLNHPSGSVTQIAICSNGIVYLGPNAAASYAAGGGGGGRLQFFHLYTEFCNGAPAFSPGFGDLWPADNFTFSGATGEIYADSNGATWVAISWVNCREFPNTPNGTFGNSFQVVINSSGVIDFAWGNLKNSDSAPVIVGYSAGDGLDPGVGMPAPRATVPSAAGGLSTYVASVPFLSGSGVQAPILASVNRPRIGQPLLMRTSNLHPSIAGVLTFISGNPIPGGIDLGALLSMPGCNAYIVLPQIVDGVALNLGAPAVTTNFGVIPNLPGNYFAQAAAFSVAVPPLNGQNILVSNAVCLRVAVN